MATHSISVAETNTQGRKRNIFQRGQSHFSCFFFVPGVRCFFPVENFHSGRPKTNFSGFEKGKEKNKTKQNKQKTKTNKQTNKQKKVLSSFCNFSSFHFKFSCFSVSFTLFSLASLFPGRSAEISLGALCPHAYYATANTSQMSEKIHCPHFKHPFQALSHCKSSPTMLVMVRHGNTLNHSSRCFKFITIHSYL